MQRDKIQLMDKSTSLTYWERYYNEHRDPTHCSPFASFVLPFLKEGKKIVELGCGNGRDSIFFAKENINVLAVDQCKEELDYLNSKFEAVNHLKFMDGDMTNLPPIPDVQYLYSRFTIHAIDQEAEKRLIEWSAENLNKNGLFFIEVRSVKDELCGKGEALGNNAYFTDHYRRFIVQAELEQSLTKSGFDILYSLESNGLAVYKTEDPVVIRLIAQKK